MRWISILACAWLVLTTAAVAEDCPDQSQQGLNDARTPPLRKPTPS
jgi:hypothetical protein